MGGRLKIIGSVLNVVKGLENMQNIKIKREFEINAYKNKKVIIVRSIQSLQIVLGTSSVSGNLHMYPGLKKIGPKEWHVPIELIRARIEALVLRSKDIEEKLVIMRQIIRG